MITHETGKAEALVLLDETLANSDDDNEVECILQRKLIRPVAEKFLRVYEWTNGRHGCVSIQGDPIHEEDPQVIIDEARKNRAISPNIMIKIRATKAGLEAMGVLIEEITSLNATEVMGLAQVIDLCEMYKKMTAKTKTKPIIGEKRRKGGQERRVVEGEKAPKRGPPQETDDWGLETVPDARGQEG